MSANPTVAELVAYYQALLPRQYAGKPHAAATIGALAGGADGQHGIIANAVALQVRAGFDLKTAVGKQLDFLGELIGVTRYFEGLDVSKTYLAFPSINDPSFGTYKGFSSEQLPQPPSWYWLSVKDFLPNTLVDSDYRRVLMFVAQVNASDYSYSSLDATCYNFFGGNANLKVTGNMSITYQHLTSDTDNLFSIVSQMGLLPAPAGVTVATQEVASFS